MATEASNKPTQGKDTWGTYTILTGYEGSDTCFWCGGPFPDKRRRRFCCEGCRHEYDRHFFWPAAAAWCLERAGYKCHNCGTEHKSINTRWCKDIAHLECDKCELRHCSRVRLEAAHIKPLDGAPRTYNILNRPENLMALCPSCHRQYDADLKRKESKRVGAVVRGNSHIYLSNGEVAWRIGDKRLAGRYQNRIYLPPLGWFVSRDVEGWTIGVCGELRRPISQEVEEAV